MFSFFKSSSENHNDVRHHGAKPLCSPETNWFAREVLPKLEFMSKYEPISCPKILQDKQPPPLKHESILPHKTHQKPSPQKSTNLKFVRRLPKFKDCNFSGKVTRCNGWLNISPKDKLCNFDGSCTSCDQVTTTTAPWGELKTAVGYHVATWSPRKMQQPTTTLMSRKLEHLLAFLLSSKD